MPFVKSVEYLNRYAAHLPESVPAGSLTEASHMLNEKYGEPTQTPLSGSLVEMHHELEDRDIWLYREASTFIAIRSAPKPIAQAFFRPCSGYAGTLTGTGSATGFHLFFPALLAIAHVRAQSSLAGLLPMACSLCNPCICLPIGPYPSGIGTSIGLIRTTITMDVSAQLFCV